MQIVAWMEIVPGKRWYKNRYAYGWRFDKTYVHRTIRGKGIVGRLFRRRR
jgi:hypothetical protein